MARPETGDVTRLLQAWSGGDKKAPGELAPYLYRELRRLAAAHVHRERWDHTPQPTAPVHEAYSRLVDQTQVASAGHAHFFGIAANLMRQIPVNPAKEYRAVKRGGGNKIRLKEGAAVVQQRPGDFVVPGEAWDKPARVGARQSLRVELRYFGGLTEDATAEAPVSTITVTRDWRIAKAFPHGRPGADVMLRAEQP